jgi:hypothetical protein
MIRISPKEKVCFVAKETREVAEKIFESYAFHKINYLAIGFSIYSFDDHDPLLSVYGLSETSPWDPIFPVVWGNNSSVGLFEAYPKQTF